MRRDKKAAKKKQARERARATARAESSLSVRALARNAPFGPAFIAGDWESEELPPELLTVIITRRMPNGLYLPHLMLVDRTCLGVKNATVADRFTEHELRRFVERVGRGHDGQLEEVDVEIAQSVVFAAIDYAERLGFRPHRDFEPELVGPRPDTLAPTAFASRARPFYAPGPYDDEDRVIARLRAAVGPDGFDAAMLGDVDEYDDEDFEDEAHEVEHANDVEAPDERALFDAVQCWLTASAGNRAFDVAGTVEAYAHAVLGRPAAKHAAARAPHVASDVWGALFRPLKGGKTGLDLAREHRAMRPHAEALAWIARTRARIFEVLAVDARTQRATCRDVLEGGLFVVRLGDVARTATRWMRFFGYLTPMPDGTHYAPSTLFGSAHLKNVDRHELVTRMNELLVETGVEGRIDVDDPVDGLTRFGAIAHGLLGRLAVPTREEIEEATRPMYLVNSDGERFEMHEAALKLPRPLANELLSALASADDFAMDGELEFGWTREPKTRVVSNERVAMIALERDGLFFVTANSVARYGAFLDRLSALAGTKLTPSRLHVMRPWEHQPNAVAEETAKSRRVVCASQPVELPVSDPEEAASSIVIAQARRSLDEHVPMLGGRPRDLVANGDEGRRRVERWLADWELRGAPTGMGGSFLDLDALRGELGLPSVASTLT